MSRYARNVVLCSVLIVAVCLAYLLGLPAALDAVHDFRSGAEVIESGAAYGVAIGGSKEDTYWNLAATDSDGGIMVSGATIDGAPHRFVLGEHEGLALLMPQDHWHIVYSDTRIDTLQLDFTDGKLTRLIRVWAPSR